MNKKELYPKLVCALTHNLDVCLTCQKCGTDNNARLNLITELAKVMKREVPWEDKKEF